MTDSNEIIKMLTDADPYVRRDACSTAGDARMPELVPNLVGILRDEDLGVREAALNALIQIGGATVARRVVDLLRVEDSSLRNIAVEILENVGPDSVDVLIEMLGDADDDIVKFAVDIISNIKEQGAVPGLSGLMYHKNPNVRSAVAVCLGRIRVTESVPLLLTALGDTEEWVRFSAIEGLGYLRDKRALAPLLSIIEKEMGLVKEAAIDAVSKIATSREAADILIKLEVVLKKSQLFNMISIVDLIEKAMSLGGNFRPTEELRRTYYDFLVRSMDDSDNVSKLSALKGIGLLKVSDGLGKVFEYVNSIVEVDEDTEAVLVESVASILGHCDLPEDLKRELKGRTKSQRIILKALGELKCQEAVPLLADMMHSVPKHELRDVVSALEAIGSMDSIEVLYQSLNSADGHTRKIAARTLAALAGERAVEDLFRALRIEVYRDVIEEITDVLALIPSGAVKKNFLTLLADKKDLLREMGARGLGLIGDEEALRFLYQAVEDKSADVRKVAYKSIAKLGIPSSAGVIVKGLKDPHDDVKLSVLKALSGWTNENIKSALKDALKDRNIWIRYHAVLLLADMPDDECARLIIDMLRKDEAPVKAAAARALEKMYCTDAIEALEQFIDHPDATVKAAVESAISSLRC